MRNLRRLSKTKQTSGISGIVTFSKLNPLPWTAYAQSATNGSDIARNIHE